jgi:hypothetical protein
VNPGLQLLTNEEILPVQTSLIFIPDYIKAFQGFGSEKTCLTAGKAGLHSWKV